MSAPVLRSARRDLLLRGVVLTLGAVALSVSGWGAVRGAFLPGGSGDFQWSGAHLFGTGLDPYRVALTHGRGILMWPSPNYGHLLYLLLWPVGGLPFSMARVLWVALNVAFLVTSAVLVGRAVRLQGWTLFGFVALLIAAAPTSATLAVGQQSPFVLFTAVLAFRARSRLGAGTAIALSVTNYSFAPLALVIFLRHRGRSVAGAAVLVVLGVITVSVVTGTSLLDCLTEPLRVSRNIARGFGDVMTMSAIASGQARPVFSYALALLLCLALAWGARRMLRSADWVDAMSCGVPTSLICFPHLLYDFCLLLPVVGSAWRRRGGARWTLAAIVAFFWFTWSVGAFPFELYRAFGVSASVVILLAGYLVLVLAHRAPRGALVATPSATARGCGAEGVR